MKPQEAPPGVEGRALSPRPSGFLSAIEEADAHGLGPWSQEYLEVPSEERVGVCCSGGGIRSASYCLGALQILEEAGVLREADYLAAVSGGDDIALAHTAAVAATFGDFTADEPPEPPAFPTAELAPDSFASVPSFARNSPEERNRRDDSAYLARGLNGKVWLGVNVLYGTIRHLLPFVAGIFIVAAAFGFGFHPWIGHSLNVDPITNTLNPMKWGSPHLSVGSRTVIPPQHR